MRTVFLRLAGLIACCLSISAASAHAVRPILPARLLAPHAVNHISLLLLKRPPVVTGFVGSGSTRALLLQLKTINQAGFAQGQSASVSQIINQASISYGSLNGQEYLAGLGGGNTYFPSQPHYMAIGSNPLASNTGSGNIPTPNFPAFNVLSLVNTGSGQTVVTTTTTAAQLLALKNRKPVFLSGAGRAFEQLFKNTAVGGYNAGVKSVVVPGGTIVGGEFTGALYISNQLAVGQTFTPIFRYIYAFGNNPLNTTSIGSTVLNGPVNYILYSNGVMRTINTGGIFAQYYTSTGAISNFVPHYFSFGDIPDHFTTNPQAFTATSLLSFLLFK